MWRFCLTFMASCSLITSEETAHDHKPAWQVSLSERSFVSTSDWFQSDVLLLSKVREFVDFQWIYGRPWEAVGGCGALIGWDSLTDLSEPIRGARPPTASQIRPPKFGLPSTRPPTFSHVICLSQSEETASHPHGLRSERPCGRPIGLSRTPGDAVRSSGEAAQSAQGSDSHSRPAVGGQSDSHGLPHALSQSHVICQRVRGGRPSTVSHYKVMWSVWESEVRGRVGGQSASHTHRSNSTWQCCPILWAVWLISRLNALLHSVESDRCAWEADQPPTRPLTSDSLTDRTLWQIRQIRSCLLIDWLLVIDFIAI